MIRVPFLSIQKKMPQLRANHITIMKALRVHLMKASDTSVGRAASPDLYDDDDEEHFQPRFITVFRDRSLILVSKLTGLLTNILRGLL